MTATIPALLQPLKDRLAAATPGPWFAIRYYVGAGSDQTDPHTEVAKASFKPDAELIAAAPTDQAKLIAAIEAVAGLHEPFVWDFGFGPVTSCRGCADQGISQEASEYPCATVRAIAHALGGAA